MEELQEELQKCCGKAVTYDVLMPQPGLAKASTWLLHSWQE
jgi:hypothetical protein